MNHPVDGSGLLYEAKTKMLTLTSEGTSFIQVYSITGNLVKSSEKRSLSLSDLRAGVYVVQARINQRKTSLYITLD